MITRQRIQDVMPKTNKQSGLLALGVLSVLLAVPTLLYMWVAKKDKDKREAYY